MKLIAVNQILDSPSSTRGSTACSEININNNTGRLVGLHRYQARITLQTQFVFQLVEMKLAFL